MLRNIKYFLGFVFLIGLIIAWAYPSSDQDFYCGVNFVGTSEVQDGSCFNHLENISANSVTLVPFSYGNSKSGELTTNPSWQWWGESLEGTKLMANYAHEKGLKVMIKPQVWFDHGTFTGDVKLDSEEKWEKFETAYKSYILEFAKIAEETNTELLAIGTELKSFVNERPEFWNGLISEVKEVYNGQLTYAANWDNFNKIPFWDKLDFIGVDAYFPLIDTETPSSQEIADAWVPHILSLKAENERWDKKILFCEFGFRSMNYCAEKPWISDRAGTLNLTAQEEAYSGTFESVWKEEFMAGGFLWKWFPKHEKAGGNSDNRFTPQNKPAEKIILKHFKSKFN